MEREQQMLQSMDRPLSKTEEVRLDEIGDIIAALRRALRFLGWKQKPRPEDIVLKDGRFQGGNAFLKVDLRVDEAISGVISADFYRSDTVGQSYVASIRTTPGQRIELEDGDWEIIAEDEHGGKARGSLTLKATDNDPVTLNGELFLNSAIHGLPSRRTISFSAEWESVDMRTIGVELESEKDVAPLPKFEYKGQQISLEIALAKSGINVIETGRPSQIPANSAGWGNTQLHTLLRDFSQASLTKRAWELHLLLLSKSTRQGLLGVMFDTQDDLPRQGTAVFAEAIRELFGTSADRKLIQTTTHELGHALNLAHRFERIVGRADSLSFMNYDWRYKGGNHRNEYWSKFDFTFDADELEFIRHAPLTALIPGGAAFHSINYWANGNGGYSPYVPEVEMTGYKLTLTPPIGGAVFEFGQPVFLGIELTNQTGQTVNVPPVLLDPKAGFLEVLIRRWQGDSNSGDLANADIFVPIFQRCFDLDESVFDIVPNGQAIKDNLNITFGSGGFAFAEPGVYDVTALVAMYDSTNQQDRIIRSNTLRIRVGVPKSNAEEQDGMVLLRSDVGLYFALGGSDGLDKADDDLAEVLERRMGRAKTVTDPVAANIVRCKGINAGRPYIRFQNGKFNRRDGDQAQAAEWLDKLGSRALRAFDVSTAVSTEKLAAKHRQAV
ncbi:MAG: acetyltransferase [Anaerolineae bacterium]|nr:acetyltransferase [Anaerolineae bacterium]